MNLRLAVGVSVVAAACSMLTACAGETRSVAAFCQTFKDQSIALHDKYQAASDQAQNGGDAGALSGMVTMLQTPGDLVVMFDALDKHAPDEIEPSVAVVLDSLKKQQEAMSSGDIGSMLGGGIMAMLTSGGAWTSVNTYISDNCDLSFQK